MFPAIFLDRDGVLIHNREHYVRSWNDVRIYPQALVALQRLRNSPYRIIVVTNQAVVAKGLISLSDAAYINERMVRRFSEAGSRIDGIFMCPHGPEDGCDCRKPKPGLLLQAKDALDIDLSQSIMVGDALTDIQAGQAAGIPENVLLMTGRGRAQRQLPQAGELKGYKVFQNLNHFCSSLH